MTPAIGVVDLGDDGALRVGLVVTPEHADRVKGVAETPRSGEHHHAGGGNSVIVEKAPYIHMILLANPGAPAGEPSQLRRLIEVDEPIARPVLELVHQG